MKSIRKISTWVIFVCCSLSFIILSTPVHSADKKTRLQIKHKSRDLEKINAALQKKRKEKELLKKQEQEISTKVQKNSTKMYGIEKSLLYTIKKNREIQVDLAKNKLEYDDLNENLGAMKKGVNDSIQKYYVSAQLVGAQSTFPVYLHQSIQSQMGKLRDMVGNRTDIQTDINELSQSFMLYQQEVKDQQKKIGQIKSGLEDDERRLAKVKTREQILTGELKELEQTANELASLIEGLRSRNLADIDKERKERLQKQALGKAPIPKHSLDWPARGRIVRNFGRQKHPTLGTPYISNGLKLVFSDPQELKVVSDGTILYAGDFMSYGPMVVVEHAGDWFSVYGNMSRWEVEKGQEIKSGSVIGWSGISEEGKNEAYFELRFYGKPTDPKPWLRK